MNYMTSILVSYFQAKNVYKCIYRDLLFVGNFTLDIKECVFVFISVRHLDNSEIFPIPFDHKYDILNIYCMILKSEDVLHAVECSVILNDR